MKLILTTLFDKEMSEVGALCVASIERFFHGQTDYEIRVFDHLLDPELAPSWNKVLAVQSLIPRGDWILWIDADCVFRREGNLLLYTETKADFRPAQDYNGINCGVFFIRSSTWSAHFLNTLLFLGDVANDTSFGRHDGPKWEQNAVKSLQSFKSVAARTELLPREFVSDTNTGVRAESIVHHAYAMPNAQRLEVLSGILHRAG